MRSLVFAVVAAAAAIVLVSEGNAFAGAKEECLEAHGRGQVERDKGLLSRARHTLMVCAQSTCPSIVQADCAKMSEDLAHLVPTVTFVARDPNGADLPATMVYVDDALVTTRLDDGKSYELDPGKHVVRFVHEIGETTLRIVLNQGEKSRVLVATFTPPAPAPAASPASSPSPVHVTAEPPEPRRPIFPLVVAGIGAAALATGGVLTGVGLGRVPSSCSLSTNECATSATDPALNEAKNGTSLANKGIAIGVAGAFVLAGGLVWYLLQPAQPSSRRGFALPNTLLF